MLDVYTTGAPNLAFDVSKYLPGRYRVNESEASGDSLLAALLSKSNTETQILWAPPISKDNMAVNQSLLSVSTNASDYLFELTSALVYKDLVIYGPKGLCLMLSYIHKRLLSANMPLQIDVHPSTIGVLDGSMDRADYISGLSENTMKKFRDYVWTSSISREVVNSANINGRICDALLRAFDNDVDAARSIWRSQLLPLAEKVKASRGDDAYAEMVQKAFEALMFVCGRSFRPDVALEISKSVRKRSWTHQARQKLAASYRRGSQFPNARVRISALDSLVNKGLEASIGSELGVMLQEYSKSNKALPKIRFKMK